MQVRNPALDHFDPENAKAHPKKHANELRVALVAARSLSIEGEKAWALDPVAEVTCGDFSRTTRKLRATRDPVWNAVFVFRLPSEVEFDGFSTGRRTDVPSSLNVEIKNGSSVLGRVAVDVRALRDRKARRGWYALGDEKDKPKPPHEGDNTGLLSGKKASRGDVELAVQWLYEPDADFDLANPWDTRAPSGDIP